MLTCQRNKFRYLPGSDRNWEGFLHIVLCAFYSSRKQTHIFALVGDP